MRKSLDFYKVNLQSLSFSGLSGDEQETVIVFGRNSHTASVETTDSTLLTKLKKHAAASPDTWVLAGVTTNPNEADPTKVTSVRFECPKKLVSLRSKSVAPRELTEEERQEASERMKRMLKAKEEQGAY